MAEETGPLASPEPARQAPGAGPEDPGTGETDYKALYEQWKNHSRDWEKQAKANKAAADELAKVQKSKQTAEQRIEDLEKRLNEKEQAEEHAALAAKVAKEKGVPAHLLVGGTEEEMAKWADDMLAEFKKKPAPKIDRAGNFEKGGTDSSELREFARKLLA